MILKYTSTFKKQYKKLPKKFQDQFDARLRIFVDDSSDLRLQVHPLKGKYKGYWSMSVSGDFRALFLREGEEVVLSALIGTHSQLYG